MPNNCWQVKGCGREPGGARVAELGECPAPMTAALHGVNRGEGGGRACWAVSGTRCDGEAQGTFTSCRECDFYHEVRREEGGSLVNTARLLRMLEP